VVPLGDRVQWLRDREALASRYTAIDAYADALDKIAKAHASLVEVLNGPQAGDPALRDRLLTGFARDVTMLAHVYGMEGGPK